MRFSSSMISSTPYPMEASLRASRARSSASRCAFSSFSFLISASLIRCRSSLSPCHHRHQQPRLQKPGKICRTCKSMHRTHVQYDNSSSHIFTKELQLKYTYRHDSQISCDLSHCEVQIDSIFRSLEKYRLQHMPHTKQQGWICP